MSLKKRSATYFVFNFIFSVVLILLLVLASVFFKCFGAAERLPAVIDYSVMRFMIYGNSIVDNRDTVSAQITILDTAGAECVTVERSWNGSSLSVDFVSAEFFNKIFLFPLRVYGKDTITTRGGFSRKAKTTLLASYYLENEQCILFGTNATQQDRRDLYALAKFAVSPISSVVGISHRYSIDLSQCEAGVYYSIVTGTDGSLRIEN